MSAESRSKSFIFLCIMMFLQFFVWGSWFSTIGLALAPLGLGEGGAYAAVPLGAIFAPLFLGIIADRFFPSQVVMGVLFLVGGILLFFAQGAAAAADAKMMNRLFLAHMLCYMPTLGLANTICFTHLDRVQFPRVRVWGTIGWIAAGLLVGLLGWSAELKIFQLAAIASVCLGMFSFLLPSTPPPAKGEPINIRSLLMVDAWKLLAKPAFLVFIICSGLICIPLAYYFGATSKYLANSGFVQAAPAMTVGQMSEIFFMLLIPFFFRRLGVKWMILVGMSAWIARYLLFAIGAPDQIIWMLWLGLILHGICYDFFFVTGFMYTDAVAPKKIRGQAQSMLVFVTQGIGMYIGYSIVFGNDWYSDITKVKVPSQLDKVEGFGPLNEDITEARGGGTSTFIDGLVNMFKVNMPEGIEAAKISTAMDQWKAFWMVPAIMAAVIMVIFFLTFWDKTKVSEEEGES